MFFPLHFTRKILTLGDVDLDQKELPPKITFLSPLSASPNRKEGELEWFQTQRKALLCYLECWTALPSSLIQSKGTPSLTRRPWVYVCSFTLSCRCLTSAVTHWQRQMEQARVCNSCGQSGKCSPDQNFGRHFLSTEKTSYGNRHR